MERPAALSSPRASPPASASLRADEIVMAYAEGPSPASVEPAAVAPLPMVTDSDVFASVLVEESDQVRPAVRPSRGASATADTPPRMSSRTDSGVHKQLKPTAPRKSRTARPPPLSVVEPFDSIDSAAATRRTDARHSVELDVGADADGADARASSARSSRYRVSTMGTAFRNLVHLLRPTTPVLESQIYLTVGALTLSLLLAACCLIYRFEVHAATRMNAGLVFGSIGSIVMCLLIFVSFALRPSCRRHINILLLHLAMCEFTLAVSFALEPAWRGLSAGVESGQTCVWLSTVREYVIMCSTAWTTCMAMDLYYLMTDPFTSPRLNRRKYRLISHGLAMLAAIIMRVFEVFDAPVAVGNFCWVGAASEAENDAQNASSIGVWLFIITPVLVSMVVNVYVTFVSYMRFRDGLAATLKNRHVLLREGFLTTLTFIVYSALLWGSYAGYWVASASSTSSEILSVIFSFLLSYRGSAAFVLWCVYMQPPALQPESPTADGSDAAARRRVADESDDAVRPQMNLALLDELVQFTTLGIATALHSSRDNSASDEAPNRTFTLRSGASKISKWNEIRFTDFFPGAFARLRASFGISDDQFLKSLATCTTPQVSEGASGSFLFFSTDRCYIVKSLTAGESAFLHTILDHYVDYMLEQRDTFLTRFIGSYCIMLYGKKAFFVVMENVFDVPHGVAIHQRYDIKGSWVDRNAQKVRDGAEATCRHCNLTFRVGIGRNVCPNRAGSHEPNVVLKDMDLTTKLRFGPRVGKALLRQLKRDSDFLCDRGIMDYSLLLGVIEVSYQVNQQNILTRDGSVFLDRMTIVDSAQAAQDALDAAAGAGNGPPPRLKQSMQCLRTSEVVIGPGFYYIGLIDILQTWNWSKRFERFVKTVLLRKDPDGISALPPKPYRDRFHQKLDEVIHLGHNVIATPKLSTHFTFSDAESHTDLHSAYRSGRTAAGAAEPADAGAPGGSPSGGVPTPMTTPVLRAIATFGDDTRDRDPFSSQTGHVRGSA
ncbi:hypothetical protein ATCC90586_005459 [Pythium insidiosum]|nr:hypothetical protein ATCC90586_005459 [Pythium insidiosum]